MPAAAEKSFKAAVRDHHADVLANVAAVIGRIDITNACATFYRDKINVMKNVRASIGYEGV